jgi:ribosomal protein L35
MPKIKTKKTILKRFKVTKKNKVIRGHLGARHKKFNKIKRRIRHFKEPIMLSTRTAKLVMSRLGK